MKRVLAALASSLVWGAVAPALALETSVGEAGIDARRLHAAPYNLLGRKIAIGQVEIGRPARLGFDKDARVSLPLSIGNLYYRDRPARSNTYVDPHATMVASVMVSQDKHLRGVAPEARLFASAVGSLNQAGQPEECLASQQVALSNSGDVRAINFSFGESLERDARSQPELDGNALLTQCVDWSARTHDVLYAIAGNQGRGGIPIPTDNFNGISVAYTREYQGQFSKVDFANLSALPVGIGKRLIQREINVGARRSIALVAPGSRISLVNLEGRELRASGTSFAAPHVTASVALLQEFGDRTLSEIARLRQNLTGTDRDFRWSLDSRRHEVMKAVLLNSADKVRDRGDGRHLGMARTVLGKDNRTWLDSDAYRQEAIPLNMQMGAGHLNVFRAYEQFRAGQWQPGEPVPTVGWDYRRLRVGRSANYAIATPLQEGSFVAATLAWDRIVELNDRDRDGEYDVGESFRDLGLNDFNVYLLPADTNELSASVCASTSAVDSVEHIFCPVPQTGRYQIRVQFAKRVNQPVQSYAIAWWTSAATLSTPQPSLAE